MVKSKKINEILVRLFQTVLKTEEESLNETTAGDLSISEIHVLREIEIGRTKTMTQVAGGLKISVGALTTAMNKLVTKGYVDRFRVPEDRRIVKVGLTEAGNKAVAAHEAFHLQMMEAALKELSGEQQDILYAALEALDEFYKMQSVRPMRSGDAVKLSSLKIGELNIAVPIFQGGMSIGISGARLAAAVASAGGVGTIAAFQIGFGEPDFDQNPCEANLRELKKQLSEARHMVSASGSPGILAANIMCGEKHYGELVKVAIEAGAEMIISGGGLPTSLPNYCKNSDVKLVPIVSSVRALNLIRRNWAKKHNRTPDAVIFEGPDAGGHLGFKREQLENAEASLYRTILEIKKELADLPECPLIVAGGIVSRDDVKKAVAYGADGVQIGTRFALCLESDGDEGFKEFCRGITEEDLTVIDSPLGMPTRVARTGLSTNITAGKDVSNELCQDCLVNCTKRNFCLAKGLIAAKRGKVEEALVFCGKKVGQIKVPETAEQIVRDLNLD